MAAGTRISGKLGSIALEGGAVASYLFDWTLEFSREASECSIKGEIPEKFTMGSFSGRITAKRHSSNTADDSELARFVATQATAAAILTGGTTVAYELRQIVGSGQAITGQGVIVRGGLTSPRDMAEDSLEIMLTSVPTLS